MRPALPALLLGATCIALSPIFVRVADVGPTASAFWRVALAVPLLWPLVALAPRASAPRPDWKLLLAAGFAFAGDLGFWRCSIQFTSFADSTLLAKLTGLFLRAVALLSGATPVLQSALGWRKLAGLEWISHCAGQGLMAYSLAHLPAAFSSVSLLFQPVMAALFAWILLSEPLVPLQMAGGAVVLVGIYLARRGSS